MQRVFKNTTHIEGLIYDIGSGNNELQLKTSGPNSKHPGTPFINGTLIIATDDKLVNTVQVHFSYVTAVTKSGKANETFNILQGIIDKTIGTVVRDGKENAGKIRIDSAIGLNEYYDMQNQTTVSLMRNEGGFAHTMQALNDNEKVRATFETDMLITGTRRIEPNEEKGTPEKMNLYGYIFSFRKELLPVTYTVLNPRAMDYFESLGASTSNPVFTQVRGNQVSQIITTRIEEECGFGGEPSIKEVKSSQKEFIVNWARAELYPFDDESTILASELSEMMAEREMHLAEIKKNREEYEANKQNALPVAEEAYDF